MQISHNVHDMISANIRFISNLGFEFYVDIAIFASFMSIPTISGNKVMLPGKGSVRNTLPPKELLTQCTRRFPPRMLKKAGRP